VGTRTSTDSPPLRGATVVHRPRDIRPLARACTPTFASYWCWPCAIDRHVDENPGAECPVWTLLFAPILRLPRLPVCPDPSIMPESTVGTAAVDASLAVPLFMATVDLAVLSAVQRGFFQSIRALDVEARDIPLTGAQLKAAVADEFAPGVLFVPDLWTLPLALRELRRWLDSHGAALGTHPSHRVPPLLAVSLYTDAEDTVAAKEIVRVQLAAGRRANATAATDDSPSASGHNGGSSSVGGTNPPDRLAHNVAMRFKDKAAKFSCGLGEAWMGVCGRLPAGEPGLQFDRVAEAPFLHNLLYGDAKHFYLENVQAFATSFNQAVELVSTDYNSVVRQSRVKNYLSTFRMSTLVAQGKT